MEKLTPQCRKCGHTEVRLKYDAGLDMVLAVCQTCQFEFLIPTYEKLLEESEKKTLKKK